ncbi:MAG: hypothetical protein PVF67_10535 [Anaerolineae bacterium]|jgi:hypothetical protein
MYDLLWRTGLTLAALALLVILAPGACSPIDHQLVEQVLGQAPKAQIRQYLAAIAEGDRSAALDLWVLTDPSNLSLQNRHASITTELLAYGPTLHSQTLDIVWWRTCCEPAIIDDPGQAGGARVQVLLGSETHPDRVYTFDLLVPGGYWGEAAGNPVRRWSIVDIYPQDAPPLAWSWR